MRHTSPAALILLLIAVSAVYAQPADYGNFLESTADAILKFFAELAGRLVFLGMIWTKINIIKYEVYDNLPSYLLNDPPLNNPEITAITGYFIKILEPLYVTAIVLTGMYLLFFSGTPRGRSRAKTMLIKLVVGMVVVSLTMPIMQIIFSISSALTQNVLSLGPLDIGYNYKKGIDYLNHKTADLVWINIAVAGPVFILSLILVSGIFIMLAARFFILILLVMFFPFTVFLSLFNFTKNIGKAFLKHMLFWTFLPLGYALVLVTIAASSMSLSGIMVDLADIISLSGAVLVLFFPFIMFKLIDWITVVAVSGAWILGQPARSLALSEEESEYEAGQREGERTEGSAAVGTRGYQLAKKRRRFTSPLAAIGLGGYKSATEKEEKERRKKEKEKEEKPSFFPGISKPIPPGYTYGMKEKTEESEITYGFLGQRITNQKKEGTAGLQGSTEEGAAPGTQVGGVVKTTQHLKPGSSETVMVRLGANYINSLSLDISPGETKTIEIILTNEGNDFSKLRIYDEELSAAGFHITYNENLFGLKKGDEKLLKIKITAIEGLSEAGYDGNIVFNTEKNTRSVLDLTVNAKNPVGAHAPSATPGTTEAPEASGQAALIEEGKDVRKQKADEMLGIGDTSPIHSRPEIGETEPGKEQEGVNIFERKSHTVFKKPKISTRVLEDDSRKKKEDAGSGLAHPSAIKFGHGGGGEERGGGHARGDVKVSIKETVLSTPQPNAENAQPPTRLFIAKTAMVEQPTEMKEVQKELLDIMGPVMSFTRLYKFGKLLKPREKHEGEKIEE